MSRLSFYILAAVMAAAASTANAISCYDCNTGSTLHPSDYWGCADPVNPTLLNPVVTCPAATLKCVKLIYPDKYGNPAGVYRSCDAANSYGTLDDGCYPTTYGLLCVCSTSTGTTPCNAATRGSTASIATAAIAGLAVVLAVVAGRLM